MHNYSPSLDSPPSFRLSLIFAASIEYCLTYVPPSSPIQKVILIGACVAVSLLVLVVCLTVGLNWDEQMDFNISAAEDLVSVLHCIFLSCARQAVFWRVWEIFRTVLLWLWSVLCLCSFSYPWQTYRPLKTLIFKQWKVDICGFIEAVFTKLWNSSSTLSCSLLLSKHYVPFLNLHKSPLWSSSFLTSSLWSSSLH